METTLETQMEKAGEITTGGIEGVGAAGVMEQQPGESPIAEQTRQQPQEEITDRVRANTASEFNARIDRALEINVRGYSQKTPGEIRNRIRDLDQEWDVERVLETNASLLAFTGVVLSWFGGKRFLVIPSVVLPFLFLHAIEGWCPPLPLLRRLGIRTRGEIEQERYALKVLLGDFSEDKSIPVVDAALRAVQA